MAYASLADFLEELDGCGQLARVAVEVDPALEIAEITRRVARGGGQALLFERAGDQPRAVLTNLLASDQRVCRALGLESIDGISTRIETLIEQHTPHNWFERLKAGGDSHGADRFRPKVVKNGPCQQVVRLGRDVELCELPLVTQWPGESAPTITGGLMVTQDRHTAARAVTVCPLVALDTNRLAVADDGTSPFARDWSEHRQAGEKMPVAVVLGGDPAAMIAAHVEIPPGVDMYHLIGLLRGKPLDVVKCRTHPLEVAAEAELVLEGYLDPLAAEAPVTCASVRGTHHRRERLAPVLSVTAITERAHAIVPAAIDAGDRGEAGALVKVRERLLLPALRTIAPGIVDLHLPALGGPRHYAFVAIHKSFPFEARQVACALWGSAALGSTKFLVLVDAEVEVRNVRAVLAEAGANVAPARDLFTFDGPPIPTQHGDRAGAPARRVAIDATTKIAGEQASERSSRFAGSAEIEELVSGRWQQYGLDLAQLANAP